MIFMDSEDSSVDDETESDYESRLYSLVHYSESTVNAGDSLPVTDASYLSKGSKASRLNAVTSIVKAADCLKDSSELRSLVEAYKAAQGHSTPAKRKQSVQNLSGNVPLHRFISGFSEFQSFGSRNSSVLENGAENLTEDFNVAPHYMGLTSNEVSCDSQNKRKTNDKASKSGKYNSVIELEVRRNKYYSNKTTGAINKTSNSKDSYKRSRSEAENDKNDSHKSTDTKNKCQNIEIKTSSRGKLHLNEDKKNGSLSSEAALSKYSIQSKGKLNDTVKSSMETIKTKKDISKDTVICLDDDDSDVEVEPPGRESPPIVIVSSDGEEKEGQDSSEEKDDIVVLYTAGTSATTSINMEGKSLTKNSKPAKEKKEKNRSRNYNYYPASIISPSSWTKAMARFYNDSWGGEDFDMDELQHSMSGNRSKWNVLFSDISPNVRRNGKQNKCHNCNTFGHVARFCPEPSKPLICLFCGSRGHLKTRCPDAICLKCGVPTLSFSHGCHKCFNRNTNQMCSLCKIPGHHSTECPERWRMYHSVTTEEDMSAQPETLYKPKNQLFCSNCAARGHLYDECRYSTKQGNWLKRAHSALSKNKHAKRRKLNNRSNKRVKKGCSYPLLDCFRPLYQNYR